MTTTIHHLDFGEPLQIQMNIKILRPLILLNAAYLFHIHFLHPECSIIQLLRRGELGTVEGP